MQSQARRSTRATLSLLAVIFVGVIAYQGPAFAQAELPRVFLDTTYSPPTGGTTRIVNAGGDFQAALDVAVPGDIIQLQAGATFQGHFTLPNKTGTAWIYIVSSAMASLPGPGTRVTPANAGQMPKIVSPDTDSAVKTLAGAHHYRFVGVEITTTHAITTTTHYNVVMLGDGSETSYAQSPSDMVFDRCYIHGTATGNVRRGIFMNSLRTAVIDSYLSNFHEIGADSQAIGAVNGGGPFKIVNNYLEGAGENILFGGDDVHISGLVASDIEVRRNHFFKPLSWKVGDPSYAGIHWSIKNIFELKNAQRVLVEANILENNWGDAQNGTAILFTVRGEGGQCPWCAVQDITFQKNILRNTVSGINISGTDDLSASQQAARIVIRDNVLYGISWRILQLLNMNSPDPLRPGGILDLTVDHNTGRVLNNESAAIMLGESANTDDRHANPAFRNNLLQRGTYGVFGSGVGEGSAALNFYTTNYTFEKNVIIGAPAASYPAQSCSPASTCFPADDTAVEFVNAPSNDYRLAASSLYNNAGTDGKDIGADVDAVNAATATVISGSASGDTEAPVVDITSPASGATVSGTRSVDGTATDNVGVVGVQFKLDGASLGTEDTAAPYSVSWNTAGSSNGSHTLTAVARDAAGNVTTSTPVTVTVSNPGSGQAPFNGTPFAIPGVFQAEDFDLGGEGVAYHDLIGGNAGGAYRTGEDVDIITAMGNATGFVVNNIQTGEWIEYTINVATAGAYRVELIVSSEFTGTRYHVEIDGANVTGSVTVPNTGWWGTFQVVGTSGVNLTAGQHVVRVQSDAQYFNLDAIQIQTQSPYAGTPVAAPGLFQAEDFDLGGEGVAYHDLTPGNAGGAYRTGEDVDVIPATGNATGFVVNYIQTGEWIEYTIDVAATGVYRIDLNVSSEFTTSAFHVEIDGVNVTGTVPVPNTGWWGTFQLIGAGGVSLTAGQHVLRIHSEQQYFNLDAVQIS